jgi:hypothetical protein
MTKRKTKPKYKLTKNDEAAIVVFNMLLRKVRKGKLDLKEYGYTVNIINTVDATGYQGYRNDGGTVRMTLRLYD